MQSSFTFGEQRTYKYAKQLGNVLPADSQVEGLNSRYFADPHLKLYPTNTKEATQRSIINFFGSRLNSEQPPSPFPSEQVEQRLKTASDFWEAGADFFKAANEVLEVPSFTEKFALEVKIGDGRILSRLPINFVECRDVPPPQSLATLALNQRHEGNARSSQRLVLQ